MAETDHRNLPTEQQIEDEAKNRFTGIRGIWKAAKAEDKKLFTISLTFFLIVYTYTVTKDLKDAFIIGRQSAASISVLKVFWVPPIATFASLLVQKMSVRMNTDAILKTFLLVYVVYFFSYGIIVPYFRDSYLEPGRMYAVDLLSDGRMEFKGVVSLSAMVMTVTCWTGTLHFIMSEIWGTIVLSLLFIQLFNEICWERQFKRFIPVVYMISNLGLLLSAFTSLALNTLIETLPYRHKWKLFSALFILLGFLTLALLKILNYLLQTILPVPICNNVSERDVSSNRQHVGFMKGLEMIFSTKVIFALCMMVLGYNIVILMCEASYKSCLSELAKENNKDVESSVLKNKFFEETITSVLVMSFFLFPTRNAISWFGWTKYASIAPTFALITSISVLGFALLTTSFRGQNFSFMNAILSKFGNEEISKRTIIIEQTLGIVCISLLKVMKYAAFDIAKEYFAKRIDFTYRARFRSVYDGICGRLGKAFGSVIQLVCNQMFNTMDIRISSLPYLGITSSLCMSWIFSVLFLGKKYNKSVENDSNIDLEIKNKKDVEN